MMTKKLAFYTQIEQSFHSLTKSEQKVADYVLAHMEETIYLTVTELAEKVGVGETTVLRFCRRIGYKGYQAFKMALTQEVAKQSHESLDQEGDWSELQRIIQNSTQSSIQALQETAKRIDETALEQAIQLILQQQRIVIYGSSMSGNTAADARNKFLRIGIVAEVYADAHLQAMSAATLTEHDLAIGISITGSTKDTMDALQIAKENGAKIIALTHARRSPIADISDVVLLTAGRETPLQGGSMGAKISQLLVIDLLFNGVASERKEEAAHMKERTSKAVVDKAY